MNIPEYFSRVPISIVRSLMSYLDERNRFVDAGERFIVFATNRLTIPQLGTLRGVTVKQGYTEDIVLTRIFNPFTTSAIQSFTFNFGVTGSQETFFANEMWSTAFFAKPFPFVFPRPILLKTGSGLTFNFTDLSNQVGGNVIQLAFAGYKVPSQG